MSPPNLPSITVGPRNLITDVAPLYVGNAHDAHLKSGVSVLTSPKPFTASVSVMGGAPGTRETDLLEPDRLVDFVDALVLSGGSVFGLSAASAIADQMRCENRGYPVGDINVPIIPAAILFDLLNGGDKNWTENPYYALGAQAYKTGAADFTLGNIGAGMGAISGPIKGGLGSASTLINLPDGQQITIGALVAVNSFGSPYVPETNNFWAAPFEVGDEFGGRGISRPENPLALPQTKQNLQNNARANTTIAIIATDAMLSKAQVKRLAISAHDGFARALVPAHSIFDGDLIFGVSTGIQPCPVSPELQAWLGHYAGITMARAIGRGLYHASLDDLHKK